MPPALFMGTLWGLAVGILSRADEASLDNNITIPINITVEINTLMERISYNSVQQ